MNYENPDSANFISRQEFNIVCNQLAQALEIITTLITNSGQLSADDYNDVASLASIIQEISQE